MCRIRSVLLLLVQLGSLLLLGNLLQYKGLLGRGACQPMAFSDCLLLSIENDLRGDLHVKSDLRLGCILISFNDRYGLASRSFGVVNLLLLRACLTMVSILLTHISYRNILHSFLVGDQDLVILLH